MKHKHTLQKKDVTTQNNTCNNLMTLHMNYQAYFYSGPYIKTRGITRT